MPSDTPDEPGSRIIRTPQARLDLIEAAAFYAQDSIELADRFLEDAEAAFLALARTPRMGAARSFRKPSLAGIRMWPIKGFENYLIFYRPLAEGIEVVRVLHGARDIPKLLGRATE